MKTETRTIDELVEKFSSELGDFSNQLVKACADNPPGSLVPRFITKFCGRTIAIALSVMKQTGCSEHNARVMVNEMTTEIYR